MYESHHILSGVFFRLAQYVEKAIPSEIVTPNAYLKGFIESMLQNGVVPCGCITDLETLRVNVILGLYSAKEAEKKVYEIFEDVRIECPAYPGGALQKMSQNLRLVWYSPDGMDTEIARACYLAILDAMDESQFGWDEEGAALRDLLDQTPPHVECFRTGLAPEVEEDILEALQLNAAWQAVEAAAAAPDYQPKDVERRWKPEPTKD